MFISLLTNKIMYMIWTLVGTVLLVVLYFVVQSKHWRPKNNKKKLPPGPIGFPLFGSLHLLGKLPHRDLQKLALKHGPIMHLRLGLVPTIVVSSPKAAELFLKTHDLVFASRPQLEFAKHITWDRKNILYAPYGSYWRDMRKICALELLSSVKISSFMAMRREEISLLIKFIREASIFGDVVDLSAKVTSLTADMTCRMVLGKKYPDAEFDGKSFKGIIQEIFQIASAPNLGDYIPFLARFDLQRFSKRMKEVHRLFDLFFETIIDEHLHSENGDGTTKDFVDVMLSFMGSQHPEYQIERANIKSLMMDMLLASIDTSATAIEWTMSELIKNQRILKTLQKELQAVVGPNMMVEESDLQNLEYLDMVVKESFRLHPVAPLLAPHKALEDCTVSGFHIPRKSHVYINIYAIGRDPNVWSDPENFYPERFFGGDMDIQGRDFRLLPFGSGRRICPGLQLGLVVVKLCVAQLTHCFDWKLPNSVSCSELEMEEEFGLTVPRANHLRVVPTYRLIGNQA